MTFVAANNRTLQSQKILLLESGNKYEFKQTEKYSNRVVALNQQTRTLLSSIGAWKHIEAVRYSPVRKMQVIRHKIIWYIYNYVIIVYVQSKST